MRAAKEARLRKTAVLFFSARFALGEGLSWDSAQALDEIVCKSSQPGRPSPSWLTGTSKFRKSANHG
eukprot:8794209-Pyramimonas_sp.AAC.1